MNNKLELFNNILLISGSGRNCGKTTFACNVIRQLSLTGKVYALKITPHFHPTGSRQQIVAEGKDFKIYEETEISSNKDSSRMLASGAERVYFVECTDAGLPEVYEHLKRLIPENCPVVCESGSFASVYQPGLHILIKGFYADELKPSFVSNLARADIIVTQSNIFKNNSNYQFDYSYFNWTFNITNHDQPRKSA